MYTLMCKDISVCKIDLKDGSTEVFVPALMPYNLQFVPQTEHFYQRVFNINAFDNWCADRVLSIDRRHAKKILNALGLSQSQSIQDKAKISRAYRCVSLQDSYWLKKEKEAITWQDVNIFNNSFPNTFIPIALRGSSATIKNKHIKEFSHELSTNGTYPKAWHRIKKQIVLYKADDIKKDETLRETKASQILDCFDVPHVSYYLSEYDGERVSVCACMTDEDWSIVPFKHFKQWCSHYGKDPIEEVKKVDAEGYYKMNIMTYLIGDIDNHDGNWGFYRNNTTGELGCVHPLFDLNCAFEGFSEKDGGWCLPETIYHYDSDDDSDDIDDFFNDSFDYSFEHTKTQKEAALEGLMHVNIKQIQPVTKDMFLSENDFHIFQKRCEELHLNIFYTEQKDLNEKIDAIQHTDVKRHCKEKLHKNIKREDLTL